MRWEEISGLEEHPMLEQCPIEATEDERGKINAVRKQIMINELVDPLRYGFELGVWEKADKLLGEKRAKYPKGVITELDLGGNRSSKSERAAKRVIEACLRKSGSRWWCCDSTEAQSRMNQQRLIWKYLSMEWRNEETGQLKRTKTVKVRFSTAGGFTENCLILPNESEIYFKFYEMDVKNLEGPELDGVWADELIPLPWVDTLVYRLTNRNGIFHITFTPKNGWTPTVGRFLDMAITKEWEEADPDVLPVFDDQGEFKGAEKMKRVEQPRDDKAFVIYFYTSDNPFGNYEGMKLDVEGKPRNEKAIRVYGNVSKAAYAQFPLFDMEVHVLSEGEVKRMFLEQEHERYQYVDPCPGRNWFMLWIGEFENGDSVVYREWPSFGHPGAYIKGRGDPGPWAVPGDAHDGVKGEAQEGFGFGHDTYKVEILEKEKGEVIVERWMDSRYANSPQQEREGTTTLIEQMSLEEMYFRASTAERAILNTNDGSIDMINNALYYDPNMAIGAFHPRLARINKPRLYVSELCPNTIFALKNWTGKDGQKGACKDPVDCLRMRFLSGVSFMGAGAYLFRR